MKKKGAVVFDCDGTLIPKEARSLMYWIDCELSPAAVLKGQAMRDLYLPIALAGKLSVGQEAAWLRDTLKLYIEDGLTDNIAYRAVSRLNLRPGVFKCLERLKLEGIPVAVVSYGVSVFIRFLLASNGIFDQIDEVYSAEMSVDPHTGVFTGFAEDSFVFPSNKGVWSRYFGRLHGVPPRKIYAVGDSLGDRLLGCRKCNRLALAKDETEARVLEPHMGKVIISDSFDPVTDWLKEKLDLA